jgi:hypothetical protein
MNEGRAASIEARIVPKSESAETTIRSSSAARARILSSPDVCIRSHVDCVMSRRHQEIRQPRRQGIVDKKSQAEKGSGSSRSIAEAAAKRRHSRISSIWRSGYSARMAASVSPPASNRSTVATGIRRWRTHGTPPICAGSTVMRSKFFIVLLEHSRNSRHSRQAGWEKGTPDASDDVRTAKTEPSPNRGCEGNRGARHLRTWAFYGQSGRSDVALGVSFASLAAGP